MIYTDNMYGFILVQVLGICAISNAVQQCKPSLSEGRYSKLDINGQYSVECDISTCESVTKVVFEKQDLKHEQFTPLYEGFSKTNHHVLASKDSNYGLGERADYTTFKTRHILYIARLISKDQGSWRCVVYGQHQKSQNSGTVDIHFATPCEPGLYLGSHTRSYNDGHTSLECDISTCDNVWKIVFEKKISEWTEVYEWIDKDNHHNLTTLVDDGYTLSDRAAYTAFKTLHILYIDPLLPADEGQWRCVSHHKDSTRGISKPIDVNLETPCKPHISNGVHGELVIGYHITIECDIATCGQVSKIQFDKTSLTGHEWITVFEGINKNNYQALSKVDDDYSLENRNDYIVFHPRHVLYIDRIISNDQGAWRCVVYDLDGKATVSPSLDVHLETPCEPGLHLGSHSRSYNDGHTSLECDISTCDNVSRVVYEKKISEWTEVYEGIDKDNHHTLATLKDDGYTLSERAEYAAFKTRHILYIDPLLQADEGQWRCVFHHKDSTRGISKPIDVNLDLRAQSESTNLSPHWRTYVGVSVFCLVFFEIFVVAVVIIYRNFQQI